MCLVGENDKVNLVTQRNYDKKRNTRMLCVSEFTLAISGSEMVVASFRGRESNVNRTMLDRVSVPSPIAIDILKDATARDRAHMYLFSV